MLLQNLRVSSLWPNNVGCNDSFTKKADAIEVGNGTCPVSFNAIVNFALRFGNVRNDWRPGPIGEGASGPQVFLRNSVGSMRSNCCDNQFVPLPALHKPFNVGHRLSIGL